MAVAGILGGVSTITSWAGSLFGGSSASKDAERRASIDQLEKDAVRLGKDSRPYVQLACWAGAPVGSPDYQRAVQYNMVSQGSPCRIGSDAVLPYAQAAFARVQAQLGIGNAAATVGVTLIGVGNQLAPGSGTSAVLQAVKPALPGLLMAAAVVALAVFVVRKVA